MTSSVPGLPVRCLIATIAVPLVLGACASPQAPPPSASPTPPPAATGGTAAPASASAPAPGTGTATAPQPAAAPAPAPIDPAIARPQAQKLALEAVDQLQNGDEPGARTTLERALALDPQNDLARKLDEQIRADAQR